MEIFGVVLSLTFIEGLQAAAFNLFASWQMLISLVCFQPSVVFDVFQSFCLLQNFLIKMFS